MLKLNYDKLIKHINFMNDWKFRKGKEFIMERKI